MKRTTLDGISCGQLDKFITQLCRLQGNRLSTTMDVVMNSNPQLIDATIKGLDVLCQSALIRRDIINMQKSKCVNYDILLTKQRLSALRLILGIGP